MTPLSYLSTTHEVTPGVDTPHHDVQENPFEEIKRAEPPKLRHPSSISSEYQLLNIMNGFCDLRESMLQTTNLRLEAMKNSIEDASAVLMQKLKEAAEHIRNNDFWSMLKKIANCLLSTFSSLLGFSLLSSGSTALVGGAMVASGLLSLTNLILTECEGWDWITEQLSRGNEETQQQLLLMLPSAVGLLAIGFGLAGSIYGVASGALNVTQQVGGIAQTALSLFNTITNLGKGAAESRLTWTQAELLSLEEDLKTKQQKYERLTDEVKTTLDGFNRTFHHAKEAVRSMTQAQAQLTR